jgi:hypothetical protein
MDLHDKMTGLAAGGAHLIATVLVGLAVGGVVFALHNALTAVLASRPVRRFVSRLGYTRRRSR